MGLRKAQERQRVSFRFVHQCGELRKLRAQLIGNGASLHDAVQDRIGQGRIIQIGMPLLDFELAGDDGGGFLVSVIEDFQEISFALIGERTDGEVIEEQLKLAIRDALLLRGTADFTDLSAYRGFIDEIVGRKNARNAQRIDAERASLQDLPDSRTCDYEQTLVYVTSSGGFTLRKVFYTMPSRLVGHRLRVRLYDDRLELYVGGTRTITVSRGRSGANGKHGHVVDYRHVIHTLRRKPMALMNLVYRDQLFPRDAYRHAFEWLCEHKSARVACTKTVELLSLAHERACEAELAAVLSQSLATDEVPDIAQLRARFVPDPARLPHVLITLPPLIDYESLVDTGMGEAA